MSDIGKENVLPRGEIVRTRKTRGKSFERKPLKEISLQRKKRTLRDRHSGKFGGGRRYKTTVSKTIGKPSGTKTTKKSIKSTYKTRYEHAQKRIETLIENNKKLKEDIEELNKEISTYKTVNETIKADKEEIEKAKKLADELLNTKTEEFKEKVVLIETQKQTELKLMQTEIFTLKNKVDFEKFASKQKQEVIVQKEKQIEEKNVIIKEMKKERDEYKKECQELHKKINEISSNMNEKITKMITDANDKLNLQITKDNEKVNSLNDLLNKEKEKRIVESGENNVLISNLRNDHHNEIRDLKSKYEQEEMKKKVEIETKIKDMQMEWNKKEKELIEKANKTSGDFNTEISGLKTTLMFKDQQINQKENALLTMKQEMEKIITKVKRLEFLRHTDEEVRKKLHNQIIELKGNIRVFCRVRPLLTNEGKNMNHIVIPNNKEIVIVERGIKNYAGEEQKPKFNRFEFDHSFNPKSTQKDVFDEISLLVQSSLDGYNTAIFAYGQTGSGKTFTMEGNPNSSSNIRGMIPRSVEKIFGTAEFMKNKGWEFKILASFLEIYNETLRDLLIQPGQKGSPKKLEIKHDVNGNTTVKNLNYIEVGNSSKVFELLGIANKNRSVGSTDINARSSRSHSVFSLQIMGRNHSTGEITKGTLHLCDLAGSERLKDSNATGQRLKETQHINKSLAALSNCMEALEKKSKTKKKVHIPFRNSKLTYLLKNSLGGNSKTLMFCNINPHPNFIGESINTLKFASKVNSYVIGRAKKN